MKVLRGEHKTGMIDSLARHVICWAIMTLESRRDVMHKWSHLYAYVISKGNHRKILLPMILDEDFSESGTELDRSLVCKSVLYETLISGRTMMSTSMSNLMKKHGVKGLQNIIKPMKKTYDYLEMLFEELLMGGQPFTTRTVREEAGNVTIDDVVLPHILKIYVLL